MSKLYELGLKEKEAKEAVMNFDSKTGDPKEFTRLSDQMIAIMAEVTKLIDQSTTDEVMEYLSIN